MKIAELIEASNTAAEAPFYAEARQLDDFYQGALAVAEEHGYDTGGFFMDASGFSLGQAMMATELDDDEFDVFAKLLGMYVDRRRKELPVLATMQPVANIGGIVRYSFKPRLSDYVFREYMNISSQRELDSLKDLDESVEDRGVMHRLLRSLMERKARVLLDVQMNRSPNRQHQRAKGVIFKVSDKPPYTLIYDHKVDRDPNERVQSNSFFVPLGPLDEQYELEEQPDGSWLLTDA